MKKILICLLVLSGLFLTGCGARENPTGEAASPRKSSSGDPAGESGSSALPPEKVEMVDVNGMVNDLLLQMQALERSLKGEDGEFNRSIDEVNASLEGLSGQLRSLEADLEETEESVRDLREYFDRMRSELE